MNTKEDTRAVVEAAGSTYNDGLPVESDSDKNTELQLFRVRKDEVRWMLGKQAAEADRVEFNVKLGEGIRGEAFKSFLKRVALQISEIRLRKRMVAGCQPTDTANLSHHERLFIEAEKGIRNDGVVLKDLWSELNVWLRRELGTERVLALKTEQLLAMVSEGGDGAYDMYRYQYDGLSGTDSHRLVMVERLLRSMYLSRESYAMLRDMASKFEGEIRSLADSVRHTISERGAGRLMLPEPVLQSVNERIEEFEELVLLIVEGEEPDQYDNVFEELCDMRRQLILIGVDVRNKFPELP